MAASSTGSFALAALLVLSGGQLLGGGPAIGADGSAGSATADPSPPDRSAIHWQTPGVDLRADRLTLTVGDETIATDGADVVVTAYLQTPRIWYLVADWTADDHLVRLAIVFRSNGREWFVQTFNGVVSGLSMPDGRPAYGTFSFGAANLTRTPPGQAFSGDVRRIRDTGVVPCVPIWEEEEADLPGIPSELTIEGLRLSADPRGRSLIEKALGSLGSDDPPGLDRFFEVACGRPRPDPGILEPD